MHRFFEHILNAAADAIGAPQPPVEEPWPITNAIACLKDTMERETGVDDERSETIRLTLEYAIEVVKSINELRPPRGHTATERIVFLTRDMRKDFAEIIRRTADYIEGEAYNCSHYEDS